MELRVEGLDALVIAHLRTPKVCAEDEAVRDLLLAGDFTAAVDLLRRVCPRLADDQWLEFQMKKHRFLELAAMARGEADQDAAARILRLQEALALARKELAPLALHAYCEAYSDFKACMVSLISGNPSGSSAGAGGGARQPGPGLPEFAGMVARAMRQHVECGASTLALLLRYLLLLHSHQQHLGFHPRWWPHLSGSTTQLCGRLLRPTRDEQPPTNLHPEPWGAPVACLRERDVQALRTSLGFDREEAARLLRAWGGDAPRALRDALQAVHVDERLLAELAEEYLLYRGLDVPPASPGSPAAGRGEESMQVVGSDVPVGASQHTAAAAAASAQQQRPSKVARRSPCEAGGEGLAASRQADGGPVADGPLALPAQLSEQQLRSLMRALELLLSTKQAGKAVEELDAADPSFLQQHPAAAFALHRCRFLEQLATPREEGGGVAAALAVVRRQLSPLAQHHPELLQAQLKAAMAQLLPASGDGGDAHAAAQRQHRQGVADAVAAMRAALRPRCHVREPRLLPLLRDLLSLHTAHFKLQRCQDAFAPDLGIPGLLPSCAAERAPSGPPQPQPQRPPAHGVDEAVLALAEEAEQALAAAAGVGHPWVGGVPVPGVREVVSDSGDDEEMEEGDSEEEDGMGGGGGGEPVVMEQAILTVCEITGLPRHTAIELLLVHGGDASAVLAHVFP